MILFVPPSLLVFPPFLALLTVASYRIPRWWRRGSDDTENDQWWSPDITPRFSDASRTPMPDMKLFCSVLAALGIVSNCAISGAIGIATVKNPDARSLKRAEDASRCLLSLQLYVGTLYLIVYVYEWCYLSHRAKLVLAASALLFSTSWILSVAHFATIPYSVLSLSAIVITLGFLVLKSHYELDRASLPAPHALAPIENIPVPTAISPLESPTKSKCQPSFGRSRVCSPTDSLWSSAEDTVFNRAVPVLVRDLTVGASDVFPPVLAIRGKLRRVLVVAQVLGVLAHSFGAAVVATDRAGPQHLRNGDVVLRSFYSLSVGLWASTIMAAWWLRALPDVQTPSEAPQSLTPGRNKSSTLPLCPPVPPIPEPENASPNDLPKRSTSHSKTPRPPLCPRICYPHPLLTLTCSKTSAANSQTEISRPVCVSPTEDFRTLTDPFAPPSPGVRCSAATSSAMGSYEDIWVGMPPSPTKNRGRPRTKTFALALWAIAGLPEIPLSPASSAERCDVGREELALSQLLLRTLDEQRRLEQRAGVGSGASMLDEEAEALFGGGKRRVSRRAQARMVEQMEGLSLNMRLQRL